MDKKYIVYKFVNNSGVVIIGNNCRYHKMKHLSGGILLYNNCISKILTIMKRRNYYTVNIVCFIIQYIH